MDIICCFSSVQVLWKQLQKLSDYLTEKPIKLVDIHTNMNIHGCGNIQIRDPKYQKHLFLVPTSKKH